MNHLRIPLLSPKVTPLIACWCVKLHGKMKLPSLWFSLLIMSLSILLEPYRFIGFRIQVSDIDMHLEFSNHAPFGQGTSFLPFHTHYRNFLKLYLLAMKKSILGIWDTWAALYSTNVFMVLTFKYDAQNVSRTGRRQGLLESKSRKKFSLNKLYKLRIWNIPPFVWNSHDFWFQSLSGWAWKQL